MIAKGNTRQGNFEGIIDNLVIVIIRTTYRRYYASYINTNTMPDDWPSDIGLEKMFENDRRGVIRVFEHRVEFVNSMDNPFGSIEKIKRLETMFAMCYYMAYLGLGKVGQ